MRPTSAQDHRGGAPPPVPGRPSGTVSPTRPHPDAADDPTAPDPEGPVTADDPSLVDADVPAAVGRVLDTVLHRRVARARAVDDLFGGDVAQRVADFTRTGGKRTRSQLLWWAVRACGGSDPDTAEAALRIGAALELLQTCALVHDDVMDRSLLRRGRPALHADLGARYAATAPAADVDRFGEGAGILAGDLALAWADDLVADTPLPPPAAHRVRSLWSDLRTEMVAGQYLDLHGRLTAAYTPQRALRTACLKSALYSVARPLALGAVLAGAQESTLRALSAAGRDVGLAFQLRDDLDDLYGDPERTGKDSGADFRQGAPTYLLALARSRARAAGDRTALSVLARAADGTATDRPGLGEVRQAVTGTGAPGVVEATIHRLVTRALRCLDDAPLEAHAGARLRSLLCAVADTGGTRPDPCPPPDPEEPQR
ncbi:polyprenyl synthetase family protein [Streptomyces thermodiastaticus]